MEMGKMGRPDLEGEQIKSSVLVISEMPVKDLNRYVKRLLDIYRYEARRKGLDQKYKYQSHKCINAI